MAIINKGDKVIYVGDNTGCYTKDGIYEVISEGNCKVLVSDNNEDSYVWDLDIFISFFSLYNTSQVSQSKSISSNKLVNNFKELTNKMVDTYERKNHDYGNSFDVSMNEEGLAAARIRLGDKWLRFKQLSKGNKALVKDESIRDTLLDMANYCIMTVMWMDRQKEVCQK